MASLRQQETAGARWEFDEETAYSAAAAEAAGARLAERTDRQERLTRTIESEIIPRLMLAYGDQGTHEPGSPAAGPAPDARDVENFAALLLLPDMLVAAGFAESIRNRGVSLETIFLDLFAPAARHLGALWEADLCDFVDVTMGLSRLQQLLRDLGPFFEGEGEQPEGGRRILLIPAPGEQHTFGLSMVEEFFRRAGWEVWVEGPRSAEELVDYLRGMWFSVIGMSVSGNQLLDQLAPAIRAIRRESLNRGIGVMVGGRIFVEHPELVTLMGADATASDARQAVLQAQTLLRLVGGRG